MFGSIMFALLVDVIHKALYLHRYIIIFETFVIADWLVLASDIEAVAMRPTIVLVEHMSKYAVWRTCANIRFP